MSIKAEIIAIGNELTSGDVVDTNSSYISKEVLDVGIDIHSHTSVGDKPQDVKDVLKTALGRSELIFITGGLGPTDDDISAQIIAGALKRKLVFKEAIWNNIQETLKRAGRKVDDYNKKQAYIPEGAGYFLNDAGTAPCIFIEELTTKIFMLPGVPSEVQYFFQDHIKPYLKNISNEAIKIKKVRLSGIAEASVNEIIKDIVDDPKQTIAFLPKSSELEVKITAKSKTIDEATHIVDEACTEISYRLKEFVYGYDDTSIEELLHDILTKNQKTIAVAESCTGGLVSKILTDLSGSSAYIKFNAVTYANQAKQKILGVKESTLARHGAVSEETAKEMAEGILKVAESDFGLSTTGIAGPTGGTDEKPVGLVYIGISDGTKTDTHKLFFPPKLPREEIRLRAAKKSLHLLREFIMKQLEPSR